MADYNANAAVLGMQIGGEVAGLYAQYVNNKLARRQLDRQLRAVQERSFLNMEASAAQVQQTQEQKKRQQFELEAQRVTAEGTARVKAAQLGANPEDALDSINRQADNMLDNISLSVDNMLADIIQQSKEVSRELGNQIWGLNTALPNKFDLVGTALKVGTAYLNYENQEFQRTGGTTKTVTPTKEK